MKPIKHPDAKSNKLKTSLSLMIVYSSVGLKNHLQELLSQCPNVQLNCIELSEFELGCMKSHALPDLIYIEVGDHWAQKVTDVFSKESHLQNSQTALVVFGHENDTDALKMAIRLGATDYFSLLVKFDELYPMLQELAEEKAQTFNLGNISLFINAKGGSGATTLAINTATALSSYSKHKVLFIDLDPQFSDSSDYLNCNPKYSIEDVLGAMNDLDELSLDTMVHQLSSGLYYLGFEQGSAFDNSCDASQICELILHLRRYYSHIIIDMSQGVKQVFQPIISVASYAFLVMQQNVTTVKHALHYLRTLELNYDLRREQIKLIVNRFSKKMSISVKDILNTVGQLNVYVVPNDFLAMVESTNMGTPIVNSKKSRQIASVLFDMAHSLESPGNASQGWLKRLFS